MSVLLTASAGEVLPLLDADMAAIAQDIGDAAAAELEALYERLDNLREIQDWAAHAGVLLEMIEHREQRPEVAYSARLVASELGYSDAWSAATHQAWLQETSTKAPPPRDYYDRPWRLERRAEVPRRLADADPARFRQTLAAQVGSLRLHADDRKRRALADRADAAVSRVSAITVELVDARRRLGYCLSLGWPSARTASAVAFLEGAVSI